MSAIFGDAVSVIQIILTPAIMISACGLLFLGLQNRYGRIVDRLRLFLSEKKALTQAHPSGSSELSQVRIDIADLLRRGLLVKNAVRSLILAVIFFILTSISLAFHSLLPSGAAAAGSLSCFMLGYLSALVSAFFALKELNLSYTALSKECAEEEAR